MKDKLYIIGNGFDLHHGLPTSYMNFRDDYVKKKNSRIWNTLLDFYGDAPKHDFWWKDFEKMLGQIDYAHLERVNNALALGGNRIQNFLLYQLPPLFGLWLRGLKIDTKVDKSLEIDTNSLFFTFNYTLLLENIYKVKTDNIWHIHESLLHSDHIIIGHDCDERKLFTEYIDYQKNHLIERKDIAVEVSRMAAKGAKGVEKIIQKYNRVFRTQYADIKRFIILGFSFNEIDLPYIKEIVNVNNNISNTNWILYVYSQEDYAIVEKLQRLGVDNNSIEIRKW